MINHRDTETFPDQELVEGKVDLSDWHFSEDAVFDQHLRGIATEAICNALEQSPPFLRVEEAKEGDLALYISLSAFNDFDPPVWRYSLWEAMPVSYLGFSHHPEDKEELVRLRDGLIGLAARIESVIKRSSP